MAFEAGLSLEAIRECVDAVADQAQVPASVRSYSVEGDNGTLAAELPVLTAATWHEDARVRARFCDCPSADAVAEHVLPCKGK